MTDIRVELQDVFRSVFDDASIALRDEMTAADFDGWDSLQHINILVAVEKKLNIRFATAEIARLKQGDQNIGTFVKLLEEKMSRGA